MAGNKRILVIDNNDSFTFNLVQLIEEESPIPYEVVGSDMLDPGMAARFSHVLISPGPGLPTDFPRMCEVIRRFGPEKDLLGICLGLQAIAVVYGGHLINMPLVKHGVTTSLHFLIGDPELFSGVPDGTRVGLYHSWTVDHATLPESLEITAVDKKGRIMAIKHKTFKVRGVQFHPESFMTPAGRLLIQNWLVSK